jgi:hypothetical protein
MKDKSGLCGLSGTVKRLILLLVVAMALPSCAGRGQGQRPSPAGSMEAPVEAGSARIRLFWRTETESNAYGFFVYRADTQDGEPVCINREQPLPAAGTTTTPQEYVFYDFDVTEGATYHYKLQQVDLNGSSKWLVGDPTPVPGTAKPLTDTEAAEVRTLGPMYRRETP